MGTGASVAAENNQTFEHLITTTKADKLSVRKAKLAKIAKRLDDANIPESINNFDEFRTILKKVKFLESEYKEWVYKELGYSMSNKDKTKFINPLFQDSEFFDLVSSSFYKIFDINQNGKIEKNELIHGLLVYSSGNKKEMLKLQFDAYDKNHSKTLDKTESKEMLRIETKRNYQMLQIVMRESFKPLIDMLCSQSFSMMMKRGEITNLLTQYFKDCAKQVEMNQDRISENWMKLIDRNCDGQISFEEFEKTLSKKFMKEQQEYIRQVLQPITIQFEAKLKSMMSF